MHPPGQSRAHVISKLAKERSHGSIRTRTGPFGPSRRVLPSSDPIRARQPCRERGTIAAVDAMSLSIALDCWGGLCCVACDRETHEAHIGGLEPNRV